MTSDTVQAPVRNPVHRASPLTVGTIVFLASECMFFSALFAVYFTVRALHGDPWPPSGDTLHWERALVFTVLLVVSSATMQMAVRAIHAGNVRRFRQWVGVTVALGVTFLFHQFAIEWQDVPFTVNSDVFGSLFFFMTGFHGAHVTGGLLAMAVLLGRSGNARFGRDDTPSVEVVSYYWHFVDVVWLLMFAILFFVQ